MVSVENPSEMHTKTALLLLLLYPAAQIIWLGSHVVVFSPCGIQTVHVARVRTVTSQLCVVVVPCCSGSIVRQLLYWLLGMSTCM